MTYSQRIALTGMFVLFAVLALGLTPSANGDTVYTYTGNPMSVSGATSCGPIPCGGTCPAPCFLTGTLVFSTPLPTDYSGPAFDVRPASWSFSDGTATATSSLPNFASPTFQILQTGADAQPTEWFIIVPEQPIATQVGFLFESFNAPLESIFDATFNPALGYSGSTPLDTPGTWSTSTTVPEPGSVLLLGCGVLTLMGTAIRRKRLV